MSGFRKKSKELTPIEREKLNRTGKQRGKESSNVRNQSMAGIKQQTANADDKADRLGVPTIGKQRESTTQETFNSPKKNAGVGRGSRDSSGLHLDTTKVKLPPKGQGVPKKTFRNSAKDGRVAATVTGPKGKKAVVGTKASGDIIDKTNKRINKK
jgi:hypothetical protein